MLQRHGRAALGAVELYWAVACPSAGQQTPTSAASAAEQEQRNRPGHAKACSEVGRSRGAPACRFDTECGVCHDGSACGTPMTVAQIRARGDACRQPDAAECEAFAPRCCDGGCVFAGF